MTSLKEKIDSIMQEEIDRKDAIGTVCLAFKDNKEIYRGVFGKDNIVDDKPIKDTSIFKMFSMTKPVTGCATMMLIEQGILKETDYVDDYLPGFKNLTVMNEDGTIRPAKERMTIRHLLSMTGGLEYPNDVTKAGKYLGENLFWPMEREYPDKMIPTVELMNKVGEMPLLYEPGEKWNYGLSADVLGAIIEVVTGKPYSEWLSENIFKPLGMKDTGFYVPGDKLDRLVTMHDRNWETKEYKAWDEPFLGTQSRKIKPAFESGGAGLTSTPDDYSKFALTLLNEGTLPAELSPNGEAVTLLKPETVKKLVVPMLNESQRETANWYSLEGYNYGSLMRILVNKEEAGLTKAGLGEFGWDGWAGTYVSIDPVNKFVFMYFINVTNGNREWQMKQLKNAFYEYAF
jgi:CubicO group peptidase (beta-lactamase class C family)